MSNTYAVNTTRGREFEVEDELKALGLHPWVPRQLCRKYIKEKREAKWYDRPYVGKLLFCVVPAIYYRDVVELKHVIGKPLLLSRLDIEGDRRRGVWGLKDFQAAVEAEYGDAVRRRDNADWVCQYKPGQALEILSGGFDGLQAVFSGTIQRAGDDFAKIRVELEAMGRRITMDVAPDQVRATQ